MLKIERLNFNGEWISSLFKWFQVDNAQGWAFAYIGGECRVKVNEGYGTFIIVLITTSEVVNDDEQLFRGRVFNNGAFVEVCLKLRHGLMCAQRWVDVCQ